MRQDIGSMWIAFGALILDLGAKTWVRGAFPDRDGIDLTPFLALRVRFNEGTTFGLSSGSPAIDLIATALLILVLGWWGLRASNGFIRYGAGLVAAGALGNLIDRLHIGMVTDFLVLHWGAWQSPIFNLADLWIVVGTSIVLFSPARPHRPKR
jgi:signal peptidase II